MSQNNAPEQRQESVQEWTGEKTTELFKRFEDTIKKDRDDLGAHPRWRAYYEECAQRFKDYAKVTPNGETPATPEGMKAMNDALNAVDSAIKNYMIDREEGVKFPKVPGPEYKRIKKNPEKADMPEDFDWATATRDIFNRYTLVKKAADSSDLKDSPQYKTYKAKADQYLSIYEKYVIASKEKTAETVKDTKMVQTIVWEMQNLMNAYFPEDTYKPDVWSDPEKTLKKLSSTFAPPLDIAAALTGAKMTAEERIQKENNIVDANFATVKDSPTKEVDAREKIFTLAAWKDYSDMNQDQLEGVLFTKAHMKDIGGQPLKGEAVTYVNRGDALAISSAVRDDLFTRKQDLYNQILKKAEESKDPNEKLTDDDTYGLRIMLGIAPKEEQVKYQKEMARLAAAPGQIAAGEAAVARGDKMLNAPLIRRLPLRKGRAKLNAGKSQLAWGKAEYFKGLQRKAKFDDTVRNLPERVRKGIEKEIQEGMDKANIGPAYEIDQAPRPNVSEDLMNKYVEQTNNMMTIGKGGLDRIMYRSNMYIEGLAISGPNEDTINALLASHNGKSAKQGIPPGTILHIRPLTDTERVALANKFVPKSADKLVEDKQ